MSSKNSVVLIGAGYMGKEYAKALDALCIPFSVVTRSKRSADSFFEITGHKANAGGLKTLQNRGDVPRCAIVAVNVDQLYDVARELLEFGVKRILLEKPGALRKPDFERLFFLAEQKESEVYLAYNRRFYPSVAKAREMIDADGGLTSFFFEFTEWSSSVEKTVHPAEVKEKWVLANSSHVIDLAFYVGGFPSSMTCYSKGKTDWHPSASIFSGAGISDSGALFSYSANWGAPGRWGVEFCTPYNKLILRPLESLQVVKKDSVCFSSVEVESEGSGIKPGLLNMLKAFMYGIDEEQLPTLSHQIKCLRLYEQIVGSATYLR